LLPKSLQVRTPEYDTPIVIEGVATTSRMKQANSRKKLYAPGRR
jgi:hypothetical protein